MTKVLAVANQKGGVGKTTTALSLSGALALRGRRVLVMDLDPHASASMHLRYYPERLDYSAHDLFVRAESRWPLLWNAVRKHVESPPIDFVPGGVDLSGLDIDLRHTPNKGAILKRALALVAHEYDYVILDCPPHLGVLLVNGLLAADMVVIPIQTEFLALNGLKLLFDTMRTLNRVLDQPLEYRTLATMFDRRVGACNRVLNLLRRKMGERMFDTVINLDAKFREASGLGKIIFAAYPNSRGAAEYMLLAQEVESL